MATLIGNGGHARDIVETALFARRYDHHQDFTDDGGIVIIGISDPWLRARVSEEIGVADCAWVHPDAKIYPGCVVGMGTHINYGVSMTRTTIGRHCTISPGVTICGDVTIGNRCLIGAGATICEKVTIEDEVTVAAGALVTPGRWASPGVAEPHVLKAGHTYKGVPAR